MGILTLLTQPAVYVCLCQCACPPACLRWLLLLSPLDPAAAIIAVCQLHRSLQEQDKGCNKGKLLLLLCLSSSSPFFLCVY